MRKALTLATALALFTGAAQASTVDLSSMTLNGTATYNATQDQITLTRNLNSQRGSAFTGPVAISAATTFSAFFELNFSRPGGGGADGIVFAIQNSGAGANALGGGGGGIGYRGIGPSVAVEFDTWDNGGVDINANHIGINTNGSIASVASANPGFTIQTADPLFAWVDYDGTTLDVFTSTTNTKPGSHLISAAIDLDGILGSQAYFGFTASTGGANNKQKLSSFSLEVAAVPLPASAPLLLSALVVGGAVARRKARRAA